jgi:hypothetical protein
MFARLGDVVHSADDVNTGRVGELYVAVHRGMGRVLVIAPHNSGNLSTRLGVVCGKHSIDRPPDHVVNLSAWKP